MACPAERDATDAECVARVPSARGLDTDAFPNFKALLEACQSYAQRTGLRFSPRTFQRAASRTTEADLGDDSEGESGDSPSRSARASSVIDDCGRRLASKEPALVAEVEEALRVTAAESTRSAMVCVCREFEMWPPLPPREEVDADDCMYEIPAPVPIMAQRLYNDELRRRQAAEESGSSDGMDAGRRLAATASFLVDFAVAAHFEVPCVSTSSLVEDFRARAAEWEQGQKDTALRRSPSELTDISTSASGGEEGEEEDDRSVVARLARSVGTTDKVRRWLFRSFAAIDASVAQASSAVSSVASGGVARCSSSRASLAQAASGQVLLRVVVPESVAAGGQVAFATPDGQHMKITLREDVAPGTLVEVFYTPLSALSSAEAPPPPPLEQEAPVPTKDDDDTLPREQAAHLKVVVPQGVSAGKYVSFTTPDGLPMQFLAEEDLAPGSIVMISCPSSAALAMTPEAPLDNEAALDAHDGRGRNTRRRGQRSIRRSF